MDTILIGTTAINRPELHNLIFPKWKKWLLDSGKKLVWVVNIDRIGYLEDTYETTKQNIEQLLGDINELIILPPQSNGFLGACKNISKYIKSYVDKNNLNKNKLNVMWLEDDWDLNTTLSLTTLLQYSGQKTHINLSGIVNNYIWALAPSIICYPFWEDIFYQAWHHQSVDIDAEKCVGNYFIGNYYDTESVMNITIDGINIDKNMEKLLSDSQPVFVKLRPPIAFDKGIEFLKNKSIKKKIVKVNRKVKIFVYEKL